MQNLDIRKEINEAGLRLWQIADAIGITDGNFSRKLRRELNNGEKERIRTIIAELRERGNQIDEQI